MILCKKLNFKYEEEYFNEIIEKSNFRSKIEDIKFNKRKSIEDEKEIFEEVTDKLSHKKTSLITVYYIFYLAYYCIDISYFIFIRLLIYYILLYI